MKLITAVSVAMILSNCAGVPVMRCAFDSRPDGVGLNECWDNQKDSEKRVCFDDWKSHGTYKQCIQDVAAKAPQEQEETPAIVATDEDGVKGCAFVGTFRGEGSTVRYSIGQAKEKAIMSGATHFYMKDTKTESGTRIMGDSVVSAGYIKAYDCSKKVAH